MNVTNLIRRKRDGHTLKPDEIQSLVDGYTRGDVPDYQMAAWAMAVCIRGLDEQETAALTAAMLRSGQVITWPVDSVPVVDKHSTGGIGDKVSLVLAPLLACAGLRVPMISGRGLGPTGGTLDKLESIPGFRTDLSWGEIREITRQVGCVITGATAEIAPADRKLYALRDVTATVESIPLITASIMSKKLAAGLDALVLDVKFGSGAFMKSLSDARTSARSLVTTGARMGVKTVALVSDMNQPLGCMSGNAVEVNESVAALAGQGPSDLAELSLALGAELLCLAGVTGDATDAASQLQGYIESGHALAKLREMVAAQGGDLDAPRCIAPASEVLSPRKGFVRSIDAQAIGEAVIELGGGRRLLTDSIDHSVGIEMVARLGQPIERGQPLARIFGHGAAAGRAANMVELAVEIGRQAMAAPLLIADRIVG